MKLPSTPSFPAQYYTHTPAAVFALVYLGLVTILVRGRWICTPALIVVTLKYSTFGWATVFFGTVIYWVYFLPFLMNSGAITIQYLSPPIWSGPMVHPGFRTIRLFRFIMANWVWLNGIVLLFSYWPTRYLHTEKSVARILLATLFVTLVQVILSIVLLTFDGTFRSHYQILLCRRFNVRVSSFSRAGLMPVLCALGTVSTIADESIEASETSPSNPQDVPTLEAELIYIDNEAQVGDWKSIVSQRMKSVDLVVIDMTELSQSVAWELAEAVRVKGPERVVLVGAIQFLFSEGRRIKEQLSQALKTILPEQESEAIVNCVALPVPYCNDLSNVIFAWRMCHWDPKT